MMTLSILRIYQISFLDVLIEIQLQVCVHKNDCGYVYMSIYVLRDFAKKVIVCNEEIFEESCWS
jgi:hypothetical protein